MEKCYLTESICNIIKTTRQQMGMTSKELADLVGRGASWMCRVENYNASYIHPEEARKLEEILNISVFCPTDKELLQKVNELLEENKRLKELLMEKWKQ